MPSRSMDQAELAKMLKLKAVFLTSFARRGREHVPTLDKGKGANDQPSFAAPPVHGTKELTNQKRPRTQGSQNQYKGIVDCVKTIIRDEGAPALLKVDDNLQEKRILVLAA
ncbi:hypothetical protein Droror1_Dr00001922 [Drosera rotundifolia]